MLGISWPVVADDETHETPCVKPCSGWRLSSGAARSALRAACGEGCAGQPLGGGEVRERAPRGMSARGGGGEALAGGVAGRVVDVAVLPGAPDHAAAGAGEDPDGVPVGAAARSCAVVDVGRAGVVVVAGVGECADRRARPVIAGAAKARALGRARLDGDGGLAAVCGERGADLAGEFADVLDDRLRRGDQGEDDLAARFLERAGAPARASVRAAERLARVAGRAVVLASEEARHPLLAERARVGRGRVALEEASAIGLPTSANPCAAPGRKDRWRSDGATPCRHSGHLDGKPGGACLMLVLCAGKLSWRSPGVRRQTGG